MRTHFSGNNKSFISGKWGSKLRFSAASVSIFNCLNFGVQILTDRLLQQIPCSSKALEIKRGPTFRTVQKNYSKSRPSFIWRTPSVSNPPIPKPLHRNGLIFSIWGVTFRIFPIRNDHLQTVTICHDFVAFIFHALFALTPICRRISTVRQHTDYINNGKIPFFLFLIPCSADVLILK